jgi:transposase
MMEEERCVWTVKASSEDLRLRVVAARHMGHSASEIAKLFGLSKRSVERYCKLQATTGQVAPRQIGGYRRSRLAPHGATLQQWIEAQNDLTLAELQERCRKRLRVQIGINALWHQLERLGLNFKKNGARRRAAAA